MIETENTTLYLHQHKHIFIGGWTFTGTRLICRLLAKKGYTIIGPHNDVYDYRDSYFRNLYSDFITKGDEKIFQLIKKDVELLGDGPWVIKHGHFIISPQKIREYFPDAFIISCVRDIADILARSEEPNYKEFAGPSVRSTPNDVLKKLDVLSYWYTHMNSFNHIVRLEDLLFNKENTIRQLYRAVGLSYDLESIELSDDILNIVGPPSKTVGLGKPLIENACPEIKNEIIKFGGKFGYYQKNLTVICHFYNEEYLLPFWLNHHKNIFNHGIMIDYDSTDNSVNIIKDIVPHWSIVKSRNKYFSAVDCDNEVINIETTIEGWKISINVTEFIIGPILKIITKLSSNDMSLAYIDCIPMVDIQENEYNEPCPTRSLVMQRYHGLPKETFRKKRLVHCHHHGHYTIGRHSTYYEVPITLSKSECCILWYGFSPFTEKILDRKLQIQTRIPPLDIRYGFGLSHITNKLTLINNFKTYQKNTTNLKLDYEIGGLFYD